HGHPDPVPLQQVGLLRIRRYPMKTIEPTVPSGVEKLPPRRNQKPRSVRGMRVAQSIVLHIVLVVGAVVFLIPFVWMVSTSLKTGDQVMVYPPVWMPRQTTYVYQSPAGPVDIEQPLVDDRDGQALIQMPGQEEAT